MSLSFLAAGAALAAAQLWNPFATPAIDVRACLAEPAPIVRRIDDNALLYCGRITPGGVTEFRETVRPLDTALYIASLGGDLDAPLELAEVVRDLRLDLHVVGPCISGCASFVFVAAPRRRIMPGGVLGLHNTSSSALWIAQNLQGELAESDAPLARRVERERALYASLNIDPRLLLEPQARLDTRCVETGPADPRTGETQYSIFTHYGLWTPTREQWRGYGVMFEGASPANALQAQRVLERSMPPELLSGATITMTGQVLRVAPEVYLRSVGLCVRR